MDFFFRDCECVRGFFRQRQKAVSRKPKKNLSMSKERKELIVSFVAAIVLGYILTRIFHSQNEYEAKERTPLHFATLCDPYVRIALLRFARSTQHKRTDIRPLMIRI